MSKEKEPKAKVFTGNYLQPQYYNPEAAKKLFEWMERRACANCGKIKPTMYRLEGNSFCNSKCWKAWRRTKAGQEDLKQHLKDLKGKVVP